MATQGKSNFDKKYPVKFSDHIQIDEFVNADPQWWAVFKHGTEEERFRVILWARVTHIANDPEEKKYSTQELVGIVVRDGALESANTDNKFLRFEYVREEIPVRIKNTEDDPVWVYDKGAMPPPTP